MFYFYDSLSLALFFFLSILPSLLLIKTIINQDSLWVWPLVEHAPVYGPQLFCFTFLKNSLQRVNKSGHTYFISVEVKFPTLLNFKTIYNTTYYLLR